MLISVKLHTKYVIKVMGLATWVPTWDVGRTREKLVKLVNHEPKASDLQAFLMFSQHPAWVITPGKPIESKKDLCENQIFEPHSIYKEVLKKETHPIWVSSQLSSWLWHDQRPTSLSRKSHYFLLFLPFDEVYNIIHETIKWQFNSGDGKLS